MANITLITVTAIIIIAGLVKRTDIFHEFTEGAKENLAVCVELLPTLVGIITAVGMFRASGISELLTECLSTCAGKLGFPSECIPLALIRPISGSGALAVYESILRQYSPDSFAGQVASVIIGSTETTFYTIAVYFGAVKIKNTKHTLAASLVGDITGMIFSVLAVNLLLR